MRAREVSLALGGNGRMGAGGRYWCRCPGHDDHNPSLTVKDDSSRRDGIDVRCWSAGCNPVAIKRELARRGLIEGLSRWRENSAPAIDPAELERVAAERRAEQARRKDLAVWLWGKAEPQTREVARYLSECRAIDLDGIGGIPDALRFDRRARIPQTQPLQHCPAMVAAVTDALGGVTAVHETFLTADGSSKAALEKAKFIIGAPSGGAVRLSRVAEQLGLAEGIESALSAAELHGIPTWAVLSTSGMLGFMVPPSVKRVVIFADRDPINLKTGKRPGTYAAESLGARLAQQRIPFRIQYPALGFADFNDELRARKGRADTVSAGQRVISNTCRATAGSPHASAPTLPSQTQQATG
jgi:putative DNA primase/helicase